MFENVNPAAVGVCIWCIVVAMFGGNDAPTPKQIPPTPPEIRRELAMVRAELSKTEAMLNINAKNPKQKNLILIHPLRGGEDTIFIKKN